MDPTITQPPRLEQRQLWGLTTTGTDPTSYPCTNVTLPPGGILIEGTRSFTLPYSAVYMPQCTDGMTNYSLVNATHLTIEDYSKQFYSSATVIVYVIAISTIIGWMLLIVPLSSPTLLNTAGRAARNSIFPTSGILGRITSSASIFSTGNRPALQKIAALIVAVALTVASAKMFRVADYQYRNGVIETKEFRDDVAGSMEIRVLRVVSDFFMWLAQIQTLIRLFPRYKEKMLIKWIGFLLILADIVFSCLNSFWLGTKIQNPRDYTDAIPALAYLFQLALSLLYATWVTYYALTKAPYAFYHPSMPSISIIAALSMTSLLIPIVFFIADVSVVDVAAWGDYFRWVGALASSIIVWEWVERIEAIEKDEKKDGILGREIYEGDEGLHGSGSFTGSHGRSFLHIASTSNSVDRIDTLAGLKKAAEAVQRSITRRRKVTTKDPEKTSSIHRDDVRSHRRSHSRMRAFQEDHSQTQLEPPPLIATPIDRNATASATSTVYAVHFHPVSDSPGDAHDIAPTHSENSHPDPSMDGTNDSAIEGRRRSRSIVRRRGPVSRHTGRPMRTIAALPFRRARRSPPMEVKQAMSASGHGNKDTNPARLTTNVISRMTHFADQYLMAKKQSQHEVQDLEPTVIPAPARGHTWSPDMLRNTEDANDRDTGDAVAAGSIAVIPTARATNTPSHRDVGPGITPTPLSQIKQSEPLDAHLQGGMETSTVKNDVESSDKPP